MAVKNNRITIKLDDEMFNNIKNLSSKNNNTISEQIRNLLKKALEIELAEKSVDYIRDNIREEIKNTLSPQIERVIKLTAKVGYQTVPSFYLLVYIITELLPSIDSNANKMDFDELTKKAKMMAITYLRLNDEQFADFMKSEDKALDLLDLR